MARPLASQARAVYRELIRAAGTTFAGDLPAQTQFRSIIHQTFLHPSLLSPLPPSNLRPPPSDCSNLPSSSPPPPTPSSSSSNSSDPSKEEYEQKLAHWKDVAKILRENVVQGRREDRKRGRDEFRERRKREARGEMAEVLEEDDAVYKLRLTPYTELGDNSTIRNVKPAPSAEVIVNTKNRDKIDAGAGALGGRERRRLERERRIREREEEAARAEAA